jgi:hypothetical protein
MKTKISKEKEEQLIKEIKLMERQLNIIIRILGLQIGTDTDKTLTERVGLLNLAGVDNESIAKILKTNQAIVRALISQFSKKK